MTDDAIISRTYALLRKYTAETRRRAAQARHDAAKARGDTRGTHEAMEALQANTHALMALELAEAKG